MLFTSGSRANSRSIAPCTPRRASVRTMAPSSQMPKSAITTPSQKASVSFCTSALPPRRKSSPRNVPGPSASRRMPTSHAMMTTVSTIGSRTISPARNVPVTRLRQNRPNKSNMTETVPWTP